MIGYSDSSFSSSLCAPSTPPKANSPLVDQHRLTAGNDKRGAPIQLTLLWEHVVRTQSVPKDANLEDIFVALNERLRDPEWEVRQHALRVLVDVIPVMDDTLDQRMEILLGDLVGNLGHPGPAVRKGALDSLKVYLTHSMHADTILHNIVFRGIENYTDSQLQSEVVVGIILSLPNLIFPDSTSESTIEYVVRTLITKLVQVTFQEVSLRSLTRIRDIVGHVEFDRILDNTQSNTRRDFELLCQVYNIHNQKPGFINHDNSFADGERSNWNDLNANIIQDNRWNSDSDSAGILSQDEVIKSKEIERNDSVDIENNVPSGKVILETEIQFNSSTAVTMKILEEGESKSVNDSDSDEDNRDCVVKVLSDSDIDDAFELRRRTPRRVRFGGEIVKLRTPDSDSNQPSDTDNDITITTTPTGDSSNPVIEIKFITNDRKDGKRSHQSRSLIPVPVTPITQKPKARSLPTSPSRKMETRARSKLLYQSHPNLTREHFFVDKQNKRVKQKASRPEKVKIDGSKKQANYVDNATSPMMVHKEVEQLHNLTRSPIRSPEVPEELPTPPAPVKESVEKLINDRKLSTADSILLEPKQKIREERSITTADSFRQKRSISDGFRMSASTYRKEQNVISNGETLRSIKTADTLRQKKILPEVAKLSSAGPKRVLPDIPKMSSAGLKKEHSVIANVDTFTTDLSDSESNPGRTFSSFILKDSGSDGIQSDSYIPTIDNGECLTCSSSGSEGVQTENSWETVGVLDKRIIEDMHDKDDWRIRLRGFESFAEELRTPQVSQELTPYMSSLLHFLFNAERHPRLQNAVENVLKQILSNSSPECLKTNLSQLAVSLCKMGAPAGIRLAIVVMQKLSAKALVQYLLEDPIMTSRSAKSREGAMQILLCATTIFPSTEFDSVSIANRVALVATDRKRRIRQSTLDVLAVLGQIGNPAEILEAVALASKDLPDRDGLIAAVRARLSRRQFPIVEVDGSVVYASPGVGHGADVEWVAAGSGSISPCSARSRRRAMEALEAESSAERAESAVASQRNMWSARRFKDPAETFGGTVQHSENVTWALVPVKDKEESQTKPYSATQLWTIEQPNANGDIRLNGNSGSLRPVYLLQAQQQATVRLRQTVPTDSSVDRTSAEKQHVGYSRGRSSSPPVRLVQIKGATRASRGQSSSPPEYGSRLEPDTTTRRRMFPLSVSSGSSQSRGSPPRNNWQREFQSAIPVLVGAEGRSRFTKRYRDSPPSQPPQPMVALGHHGQGVGSAPVRAYERTKSPSPTRFSTDKFNISQDSGINQQTSSGSESSDYYTPPAEPYLPLQPTELVPAKQNGHEDSFDQSDRSETPPAQQRERFINLEDSQSGSDFEDQEAKKNTEDSQDDHDFVRTQVFQKLQEDHLARVAAEEIAFRERVTESRLSKSHADLSEVKKLNRKSISSAPLVKQMKGIENHFIENKLNNNTVDEESKTSRNSSTLEITSINESQTELRSLNQSQLDVRSLNQSQGDLRSSSTSHCDLRSINQSQGDLRSLNQSQGDLQSLNESQGDLNSLNQSQVDLQNGNQTQKDLRSLNQSQVDIRNLNQSQADLRNHNYQPHEIKSEVVKCPDIVKKTPKSTPKNKVELKRRSSNMPAKISPVFPDSLRKFPKPREGMSEMISQLESPEWDMTMKGLQSLVRLIRHHPEMIEAQMHTVCVLLGRHIKNLRSQVARASCLAATEMFTTHRKALEMELEEIACPLLHRTADTNKFLRADANGALDAMCININTSRVMSVLGTRGATHHNAVVKCTAVRLTTELVQRLGSQKVFQLPKDTRDRMLLVGANMLTEGSLEIRKHAKNMFTELSGHPQFQRAMLEAVPASTMRHISKIIINLK